MNAVGIDVSKGKSTVAVLRPGGEVVISPFDVSHNPKELSELVTLLKLWTAIRRLLWSIQAITIFPLLCFSVTTLYLFPLSILF